MGKRSPRTCEHDYILVRVEKRGSRLYEVYRCTQCGDEFSIEVDKDA